jgi:hypothetical protein
VRAGFTAFFSACQPGKRRQKLTRVPRVSLGLASLPNPYIRSRGLVAAAADVAQSSEIINPNPDPSPKREVVTAGGRLSEVQLVRDPLIEMPSFGEPREAERPGQVLVPILNKGRRRARRVT